MHSFRHIPILLYVAIALIAFGEVGLSRADAGVIVHQDSELMQMNTDDDLPTECDKKPLVLEGEHSDEFGLGVASAAPVISSFAILGAGFSLSEPDLSPDQVSTLSFASGCSNLLDILRPA